MRQARDLPWRQRVMLRRHDGRGRMVLDLGCGDGVFTLALARRGGRCAGCDISAAAIAQARAFALGADQTFVLGPPQPGRFGVIVCNRVLAGSVLRAALEGLGAVHIRRWYRSPMRNWLPWPQRGAAVLLFEVRT